MKLSMIVAMSKNGVIGKNNQLPWHIPEELKYFRRVTMGKPVIMGRKTFESIGKPLPGRKNIILSRSVMPDNLEGVLWVNTLEEALYEAKQESINGEYDEAMVIGGEAIYRLFFPIADRLYLTRIEANIEGDAFLTGFEENDWLQVSLKMNEASGQNPYPYSFYIYDRHIK